MIRHPLARAAPLAALLLLAPLPFGGAAPWAAAALQIGALVAAAVAFGNGGLPTRAAALAAGALAAVATLGLLQSLAWPAAIAGAVSPEHLRWARDGAELAGEPSPASAALSLAPSASRSAAADWLAAAAALAAGAALGSSKRARRALGVALGAAALGQVALGARGFTAGATTIWGVEVGNVPGRFRGTFVNPNHLATYLAIAAAAAFALLWWSHRRLPAEATAEQRMARLGPPALLWLALFAALAFTRSRSGLLAGLAGCLVQIGLAARGTRRPRAALAGVAVLAAALGFVAWTGFDQAFGRLLAGSASDVGSASVRLEAMRATAGLAADYPATGVGLGAFRAAFPLVHPIGEEGVWWHAHSDLLELAATTGLVGLVLVAGGLVALLRGLAGAWRAGERSEDRAAALAALGALAAVGLQECIEFGLTMPANALTLAALCGAALTVPRKR